VGSLTLTLTLPGQGRLARNVTSCSSSLIGSPDNA
jgi:hypothetical protein